ncbi:MAG TPA: DUF2071 domain-containing protein [Gaiellaceae bacterium]|nr:DUF2071 domain-containing protein [Gaiellaceae bacterium]
MNLELLRAPARQSGSLSQTAHRPWPLPRGSWIMGQSWQDLLFAHWRVEAAALRKLVPTGLSVDEHDGSAWLGITPFVLTGFRLRGTLPLPVVSSFPELNVRTYVTAEDKPGIWFFSLDTSSRGAVEAARRAYRLPYFHARMSVDRTGDRVDYSSARREAARPFVFTAGYEPAGDRYEPKPGTLDHFLTERYCLYAADEAGLHRAQIHHPPWQIRAAEAAIELNTMPPDGVELQGEPLLHLADRQDVVIWGLESVQAEHKSPVGAGSTG